MRGLMRAVGLPLGYLLVLPAMGQTPPLCPPAMDFQDYGTGCSDQSAITHTQWNTGTTELSPAEQAALFAAADPIRDGIQAYLNDPNQFHHLAAGQDYAGTSEWQKWYGGEKDSLLSARLLYWGIYSSSQEISPADRARALQGMLDTTALLAKGNLLFGQQFLIEAINLRYTDISGLGSIEIIAKEQCFLSGQQFQSNCQVTDPRANAVAQFDEVLTDYTRVFNLNLGDGTSLGQRLTSRELDLLRLAVERSSQASDLTAGNLFALGDAQRPLSLYRDLIGARYVQAMAVIAPLVSGPRQQAMTLATELGQLRQSAQKLMQTLNPLGFDSTFSPLLSYDAAYGLVRDSLDGNGGALNLEQVARQSSVDYNADLVRQRQELASIRDSFVSELAGLCGIDQTQATNLTSTNVSTACDNSISLLRVKFDLMAASVASVQATQERLNGIPARLAITLDRNATVVDQTWTAGAQLAAIDYESALLGSVSVSYGASASFGGGGFGGGVSASISYNPNRQELAQLASARQMVEAAKEVSILNADSEAAVRNSLLDEANEMRNLEVNVDQANAATVEYNNTLNRAATLIALRDQAVRDLQQNHDTIDVLRLQTNRSCLDAVDKFNDAVKRAYLAAKVVEYETVLPLSGNLNPANLFTFRRAVDLNNYVSSLNQYYVHFDWSSYLNRYYYQYVSMARDLLGYNSDAMQCDSTCSNCQACFFDDLASPVCCNGSRDVDCQTQLFQEFVRRNTTGSPGGSQTLVIDFATPLDTDRSYSCQPGAIFLPGIGGNKLAGVGAPLTESRGVALTFRTTQGTLQTVAMRLTQSGHSLFRSANGCAVELSPRHPLAFLDYAVPISADSTTTEIQACVEGDPTCFLPTRSFFRRSVYASSWRLEVPAGPGSANPGLHLSSLQDITLAFDTTGFTADLTCHR